MPDTDILQVAADRIRDWAAVNTHSTNLPGLAACLDRIAPHFAALADTCERVALPPYDVTDDNGAVSQREAGALLRATRRPDAPVQALLLIHYDTVFPPDSSFRQVAQPDADTLHGPGVFDAKAGIAMMLAVLEQFEARQQTGRVGWTVLLNPDEEIGSPASAALLHAAAADPRTSVGLVFEPCLDNGDLVGRRKGSINARVRVTGRAAHAGRDFFSGRNAVVAAAGLATRLAALTDAYTGTTVNISRIDGGGATNVVPDRATLHLNARVTSPEAAVAFSAALDAAVAAHADALGAGFGVHLIRDGASPPKVMTPADLALIEQLRGVAGFTFDLRESGGACDGNRLSAAGLPTVDTLGPIGGGMHADSEHVDLRSLPPRIAMTRDLLLAYDAGLDPPARL